MWVVLHGTLNSMASLGGKKHSCISHHVASLFEMLRQGNEIITFGMKCSSKTDLLEQEFTLLGEEVISQTDWKDWK